MSDTTPLPAPRFGPPIYDSLNDEHKKLVDAVKNGYSQLGKAATGSTYARNLAAFLRHLEQKGIADEAVPADEVNAYVAPKENVNTRNAFRSQVKPAIQYLTKNGFRQWGHIELAPEALTDDEKAIRLQKERAYREKKRMEAQQSSAPQPVQPQPQPQQYAQQAPTPIEAPAAPAPQPTIFVVPQPAAPKKAPIGSGPAPAASTLHVGAQAFTGPYVRITTIGDGMSGPAGAEVVPVPVTPTKTIIGAGGAEEFLRRFVLSKVRFMPGTPFATFTLHELTAMRMPTGKREDVNLTIDESASQPGYGVPQYAAQPPFTQGYVPPYAPTTPGADVYMSQLNAMLAESRRREEKLQEDMKSAQNQMSMMMIMQQFQSEQRRREDIEVRIREAGRVAPAVPTFLPPPLPPAPAEPQTSPVDLVNAAVAPYAKMMEDQQKANPAQAYIDMQMQQQAKQREWERERDDRERLARQDREEREARLRDERDERERKFQQQQREWEATQRTHEREQQDRMFRQQMEMMDKRAEEDRKRHERELEKLREEVDNRESPEESIQRMLGFLSVMKQASGEFNGGATGIIGAVVNKLPEIAGVIANAGRIRAVSAPAPVAPQITTPQPTQAAPQPAAPQPMRASPEIKQAAAAFVNSDTTNDQAVLDALMPYVMTLSQSKPHENAVQQVAIALTQVKLKEDVFQVTRALVELGEIQTDIGRLRAITEVLHRNFPAIHKAIHGIERYLDDGVQPPAAPTTPAEPPVPEAVIDDAAAAAAAMAAPGTGAGDGEEDDEDEADEEAA